MSAAEKAEVLTKVASSPLPKGKILRAYVQSKFKWV